jgi:MFS family permease
VTRKDTQRSAETDGGGRDRAPTGSSGSDRALGVAATALFASALGMVGVSAPLLAVRIGMSAALVGALVALAGVSQIATRVCLGPLLRRWPDKVFVAVAAGTLGVSCALLVVAAGPWAFAGSQLLQGLARALFWTGSQTHAVRSWRTAVGGLTVINVANGAGSLVGPALAGLLAARSLELSLVVAAVTCVAGIGPAVLLARFPPFRPERERGSTQIWRRPGVDAACAMTAGGGAWKGLMNSYVPVVLSQAGQAAPVVGVVVTAANAAALLGSAVSRWVQALGVRRAVLLGLVPTGVGLAVAGLLADHPAAAAAALVVAGVGAGVLQTVGPGLAADSVGPEERGDAIASIGTFRAVTLLVAPLGVGALVLALPVGVALTVA